MRDSPDSRSVGSPSSAAARPPGVPPSAQWFFDSEEWLSCARDAAGELHGPVRSYRRDGTPWIEYEYRHGKRHGPFRRYHASGRVSQAGRYFDDLLDGLLCVFSDGADTFTIRECCIPAFTRVMKQEHRRGELLAESFYDEHGARLFETADATGDLESRAASEPARELGAPSWPEPLREREDDILSGPFEFLGFSREQLSSSDPDAARLEQPLATMQGAIQRAAERVQLCRAELYARGPSPLPVDVSALAAAAPPPRRFSFLDEEGKTIDVDETLTLSALSAREVALRTRIEWVTLCTLCWACGLSHLALPTQLENEPALHGLLLLASERQAALSGHDLRADAAFHFHGLDETLLPASALAHLAEQYREIRAIILFASDPECQSPWQNDLGREAIDRDAQRGIEEQGRASE